MVRKKEKGEDHGLPSLALVFGYIAVKELQRLEDRIDILNRLGYGNLEIARICGRDPTVIATLKSRLKRRRRGRRRA
ncbi:MAG: hypothetical protein HY619_07595 [Thaumarchaeota archaeon]|nr:hypothetical protein [Nitrososphaerota archaeon]